MIPLLIFSTLTILIPNLYFQLTLLALLLALIIYKQKKSLLLTRLKLLSFIIIMIIIFQLVFNQPQPVTARILLGLQAGLKISNLSLLVLFFTQTTDLNQLFNSLKFLPHSAKLAITTTLALIPAILTQAQSIRLSQLNRGYDPKSLNPLPLIIPLLHQTIQRAQHLSKTLYLKGYQ